MNKTKKYIYYNFYLLWDKLYFKSQTSIGIFNGYTNGELVFESENNKVLLFKRKSDFSQNQNCGEYDENLLKKAICQYYYLELFKNTAPLELFLTWSDDCDRYNHSIHNWTTEIAITKFGRYHLYDNGRIVFQSDYDSEFNIDSKRLVHIPFNQRFKSDLYKDIDIRKAICAYDNLIMLIKEEMDGNPARWVSVEELIEKLIK